MPIVLSVLAKGIIPDETENFLGMAARLSTKPANEALQASDLILFVGSNFPFARFFFPASAQFIQVDIEPSKLGSRHKADVAILGDAGEAMRLIRENGKKRAANEWLKVNRQNRKNWQRWLWSFADSDDVPMRVEPVFREINRIATDNAIFVTDVGNVTIHAIRLLEMNGNQQMFTTSGLFATMGYGVPGGIAAQLSYPGRQVFTLNGDGGFAMVMQDIITQVKYRLPIINIVFSNDSFGFIEAEQEEIKMPKYGVSLTGADYAKIGEAMGAKGFTVTRREQLKEVFEQACNSHIPVVIDIKILNERPFPAEAMILDPEKFEAKDIQAFKERYQVQDMPTLKELLGSSGFYFMD